MCVFLDSQFCSIDVFVCFYASITALNIVTYCKYSKTKA